MKNAIIIAAAVLTVLATGWLASQAMTLSVGTSMSLDGYAAMIGGTVLTLAVGVVLMVLVFYSSRRGYDEPAVLDQAERKQDNRKP